MKHIAKRLLDLLLPPVCPICKDPVAEQDTLCPKCFAALRVISDPSSHICGRPFPFDILGDKICAQCLSKPPIFHQARAVVVYDDVSKKIILPFKHGDALDLVPLIVKMMMNRAKTMIEESDIIVPVPLHRLRLLKRKYNQSALLAKRLAKHCHKKYAPDGLVRIRFTHNQGKLSPNQRKKNVANAFRTNPRFNFKDKHILLIDDVLTTGATANECAKVLLKAGAKQVDLLTFATTEPK